MCKSKGRQKNGKSTHVVHKIFSMNSLIERTEKELFLIFYYKSIQFLLTDF